MAINGYLTDLDGTLCNTKEANVIAYKAAFDELNVPFDEPSYRSNFGLEFNDMMTKIASDYQEKWPLIAQLKAQYYKQLGYLISPNEALITILKDAKLAGKKIGLASTAKSINAKTVLEGLGIVDLFDATVFAEDVIHKKPDPECYNKLLVDLSLTADECIIFEDTEIGITAGEATGAHVLKVSL